MKTNNVSNIEKSSTGRYTNRILHYIIYLLLPVMGILLIWSLVKDQKRIEQLNELNQEKSTLVKELENLHDDYQLVKSWNQEYSEKISEKQDRINRLIREIRFKSDDVAGYRSELADLRLTLKDYLHVIDSLEMTTEEKQRMVEDLRKESDSLVWLIVSASHLNAYSLDIRTENKRNKITSNPKRVDHVNICFTLAENIFIQSGPRDIYLRILRPDERLIYISDDDLFNVFGQELAYTDKVTVNYDNTDTRVCMVWDNVDADLTEGLYYVNIYADGREIASRSFLLEKGFLFF